MGYRLRLTCSPARAEREIAFVFALPESLPALPPACATFKRKIEEFAETIQKRENDRQEIRMLATKTTQRSP